MSMLHQISFQSFIDRERVNATWAETMSLLRSYAEKYDRFPRSTASSREEKKLGLWLVAQRIWKKQNKLSSEQIKAMDNIDVSWNVDDDKWNEFVADLARFRKVFPRRWPSMSGKTVAERTLGRKLNYLKNWASGHKRKHGYGDFPESRRKELAVLGFNWGDERRAKWMEKFNQLKQYREQHPQGWPPFTIAGKTTKIGRWVSYQRKYQREEKLPQDRVNLLDSLGFKW